MGRGVRFGIGVVAAVAMGIVNPGSALAASKLVLSEHRERHPVAVGTHVMTVLGVSSCDVLASGTVLSNAAGTDKVAAGAPVESNCGSENGKPYSISGGLSEIQVKANLQVKATLTPKVLVTDPDGCIYTFSKLVGQIEAVDGYEYAVGNTTGKLNKRASPGSCAATEANVFFVDIESEETEGFLPELLHYEVLG